MLAYVILGFVVIVVVGIILMMILGRSVQAEVYVAIEKGEYQFMALMEPGGNIIHPKVEGIPEWYLESNGFFINQTTPETKEKDLAYMKKYNETMCETLKSEGKYHHIETAIQTVGKNLGKPV